MTAKLWAASLLILGFQVLGWEQVVVVYVYGKIKSPHDGGAHVKRCINGAIEVKLLHGSLLQIGDFKQSLVQIPITLIIHFYQLFLKSLLQMLDFLFVLFLHLSNFFGVVHITSICLLMHFLLISFLLLLA